MSNVLIRLIYTWKYCLCVCSVENTQRRLCGWRSFWMEADKWTGDTNKLITVARVLSQRAHIHIHTSAHWHRAETYYGYCSDMNWCSSDCLSLPLSKSLCDNLSSWHWKLLLLKNWKQWLDHTFAIYLFIWYFVLYGTFLAAVRYDAPGANGTKMLCFRSCNSQVHYHYPHSDWEAKIQHYMILFIFWTCYLSDCHCILNVSRQIDACLLATVQAYGHLWRSSYYSKIYCDLTKNTATHNGAWPSARLTLLFFVPWWKSPLLNQCCVAGTWNWPTVRGAHPQTIYSMCHRSDSFEAGVRTMSATISGLYKNDKERATGQKVTVFGVWTVLSVFTLVTDKVLAETEDTAHIKIMGSDSCFYSHSHLY